MHTKVVYRAGVGNLRPADGMRPTSNPSVAHQATKGKKIIWMNVMCTFAWVMGVARDKNHNSFLARSGKKVVHHWYRVLTCFLYMPIQMIVSETYLEIIFKNV